MRAAGALALALALWGCEGRPRSALLEAASGASSGSATPAVAPGEGEVVELDLSSGIAEAADAGLFVPLAASRTYLGLVRELERVARAEDLKGLLVRLGEARLDFARSEELGAALEVLRTAKGVPVVCHAHSLDNATAWFTARACTRTWVSPAGSVDTVGIAGQVLYLRRALDSLHIRADFLHMGRYKSAAEALTEEGPTPEAREALTAVLGSIRATWLESAGRSRARDGVARALEDGPFSPEAAVARGLVDEIGYEDDARRDAESRAGTTTLRTGFGARTKSEPGLYVAEILELIAGGQARTHRPHVAVIPATGSIAMGAGGPLSDSGITARALTRVVRRLADDEHVEAVVLRIDSPGGSALASDLLWHELMALRAKKPVVASVGDMAASGGYYLACAANSIVAERTSIIGSIGVVGGKIVLGEALSQVGVNAETIPASPEPGAAARAAYLSPFAAWDEPTRERVRTSMESVYELFLRRVSEGRGVPVPAVRAVAEGRIWTGAQGKPLGLVDELGGLGRALELARSLSGLGADAPVQIEGLGETLVESLLVGEGAEESALRAAVARAATRAGGPLGKLAPATRPFVAALGPLLDGEVAIVALPFGVLLR